MICVCANAPTMKAFPNVKFKFSSYLQDMLHKISQSNIQVLLGDFNARVGVWKQGEVESDEG